MNANYYFVLIVPVLVLAGCVSDMDLGNGRVVNLAKVEHRSSFGVNDSRSRLRDCIKTRDAQDLTSYVYTDCQWIEEEWRQSSSPGQGGTALSGLFMGAGIAAGGALIGNAGATATSITSTTVTGGKGH